LTYGWVIINNRHILLNAGYANENHALQEVDSLILKVSTLTLVLVIFLAHFAIGQEVQPADTIPLDSLYVDEPIQIDAPSEKEPMGATNLVVKDNPNDEGGAVIVTWKPSPDDSLDGNVQEYLVMRSENVDGPYEEVGSTPRGSYRFFDNKAASGVEYFYKLITVNYAKEDGQILWRATAETIPQGPVMARPQWFNLSRMNIFIGIVILSGAIIYFIFAAKGGKDIYIRKIAGIEEVENAVGRATEMGKTIFYVPGIHDMNDVQTLASMTILGKVSQIAAQNDTRIDVPVSRSMVMVTAREVVQEAYSKVGRPESYQDDQVRYLTDDQFGYAAAIDGLFVREKPATIFLIGAFFAESLIMAETGNSIGAIQIAGTAMPAQLPFFVAACDYTLIGEELFAASAYLSREPKLIGSLKGQDVGKAVFLIAIVLGVLWDSFALNEDPRENQYGVSEIRWEYNERGNKIEQAFLDIEDEPTQSRFGYAFKRWQYDASGNPVEVRYFDRTDEATIDLATGAAIEKIQYDPAGNKIEKSFYNVADQLINNELGYAYIRWEYDAAGNMIREAYYDVNEQLINSDIGYAYMNYKYDMQGNLIEESHYNAADEPTLNIQGFWSRRIIYNQNDKPEEVRFLGVDGQLKLNKQAYAIKKVLYDDEGNKIEESYHNLNGELTITREGYAMKRWAYDDEGLILEVAFYGLDGELQPDARGVAVIKYEYDDDGNKIEENFYDKYREYTMTDAGFELVNWKYDEQGNVIGSGYYVIEPLFFSFSDLFKAKD